MQSGKLARVSILRQFKNCTFPSVVVSTYLLGFVGHRKMLFIKFNDWPFPVPSLPFIEAVHKWCQPLRGRGICQKVTLLVHKPLVKSVTWGREGLEISKNGLHYLWKAPLTAVLIYKYYSIAMKLQVYNTTKIYLIMVWEFPNKTITTRHFFQTTKKNV